MGKAGRASEAAAAGNARLAAAAGEKEVKRIMTLAKEKV